ncbi:hypothetical protein KKH23_06965 [Patescibacteria group bacterium]|nr:hypothetical protein [Patescibacteria group bacterium]
MTKDRSLQVRVPLQAFTFAKSNDDETIKTMGLSTTVSCPLISTADMANTYLVLFTTISRTAVFLKDQIRTGVLSAGNYTFYRVSGVLLGSFVQTVVVELDLGEELSVMAVTPPKIPPNYLKVLYRQFVIR